MNKLYTLLILTFFAISAINAQISLENQGFIYNKSKSEFNLPQLGIGVSLPVDAGFKVPLLEGEGVFLDMGDKTNYFLNLDYFTSPETNLILFNVCKKEDRQTSLSFFITPISFLPGNYREELDKSEHFKKISSIFNLQLDDIFSYIIHKDELYFEIHNVVIDEYLYVFAIPTKISEDEKKKYEQIVKSFCQKDLSSELEEYRKKFPVDCSCGPDDDEEEEDENNESDDEEESEESDDNEEDIEENEQIHYAAPENEISGKLEQNTTIVWESLNLSINIPKDWCYQIKGDALLPMTNNVLMVKNETKLAYEACDIMRCDSLTIIINTFRNLDIQEFVDNHTQMNLYTKKFSPIIDNKQVAGVYFGSKSFGTLGIYFEEKGLKYEITIAGVNKNNLSLCNKLFSGIKITHVLDVPKKDNKNNLPFLDLQLEPMSPITLEQDPIKISPLDLSKAFACNLSGIGAKVMLMGGKDSYICNLGTEQINITNEGIKETPIDNMGKRIQLYSLSDGLHYNFGHDKLNISNKQYLNLLANSWAGFKNYTIDKIGLQNINGTEWAVFISKDQNYMGLFRTVHNGYETTVVISKESLDEVLKDANALQTVKFY